MIIYSLATILLQTLTHFYTKNRRSYALATVTTVLKHFTFYHNATPLVRFEFILVRFEVI
jgi:hypothetical protein